MQYERLCQHPTIFKAMTGLTLPEFEDLLADVLPRLISADRDRRSRPQRRRAPGAGRPYTLSERDQVLLTVIWLRRYPTHEVLGYLFGMPDWTARRAILRVLPVLEASGLDRMRMPDPGRKRRRSLDDLLAEPPELIVLVDTFEQRVQRHRDRATADRLQWQEKAAHPQKPGRGG